MRQSPQWRITSIYFGFATVWILFSDTLLYLLGIDSLVMSSLNIVNDMVFVVITSVLLLALLQREFQVRARLEDELRVQVRENWQSTSALEASRERLHAAELDALEHERLKVRFQQEQAQNALVQRVISALSHDLRTPLTAISTARDLLSTYFDRLTPERRLEKLDSIGREVQFALELLEDTVNMARGNLTDVTFRPVPVNLAALCQVSVEEVQSATQTPNRLLFVNVSGLESAVVDDVLVSRILLNLLTNAVKYSPPHTDVRLELDQHNEWIVLRVVDHGVGIPEADLPHIFEPFYRAAGVMDAVSGTGLGLSIVKDCVTRHQGRVRVDSTVGQGTTFTVELPLEKVPGAVAAA
ncbi:MAG: HAMP domain-containing sensor histidine kinase [bacterium]|nr:HAMP domain-containing sensor histidine kinase [bacterium]